MKRRLVLLVSFWITLVLAIAPAVEAQASTTCLADAVVAAASHHRHAMASGAVSEPADAHRPAGPHGVAFATCCVAACLATLPERAFHGVAPVMVARGSSPPTAERLPAGIAAAPLLEPPIFRV